jgi:hypothetical protein
MARERRGSQGPSADGHDGDDVPLRIHTCGRVGMQASPPRARLTGWLRRG